MQPIRPNKSATVMLLLIATLMLPGCGSSEERAQEQDTSAQLPESVFLAQAPEGIQTIASLKATAQEGDEVVVRVVVGGTEKPIVEGRASATVIEAGIKNPCLDEDDHCPTPWDYCCSPQESRTANLANLRITDGAGQVLEADLASRIKPLTTLVVRGIVGPRPNEKALTINALGIYIEDGAR